MLHTALSFTLSLSGTEVLKMATQRIARIETTGGGFHFTFFYLLRLLFHLKMETFFFLFFLFLLYMATLFPPLFLQIHMLFFECIRDSRMHSKNIFECIRECIHVCIQKSGQVL